VATLHLICGLPGAGKSRLAASIEREGRALRLTPDEWLKGLGAGDDDEETRERVEALQWDLARRLLVLGVDVVLESGFWSRAERMAFRERAHALGARSKLHFLDTPRAELVRRLTVRNAAPGPHD
jgi:predicted kinase